MKYGCQIKGWCKLNTRHILYILPITFIITLIDDQDNMWKSVHSYSIKKFCNAKLRKKFVILYIFWLFSQFFDNPYSYSINLPESQKVLLNCLLPSPTYIWRLVQSLRLHKELLQHYTWTWLGVNIHHRPRVKIPLIKQKYQIKKPQIQE